MIQPTAQRTAPNIVVIMTDDQGPWALPGTAPDLQMPELARLMETSLTFDKAYCASPVCSPARASILTGRMPSAHGVHDWLVGTRDPEAYPDHYLADQPTTPETLARAGYQCAHSGKWHVGDSARPAPGFEWWYAHRYGGGPYYDAPVWRDGEPATEPGYLSDAITEDAVTFLRQRDADRPFYLQVHYTAPHTPWLNNHPDDLVGLYEGCDFSWLPDDPPHPWMAPRQNEYATAAADPVPHLTGYFAALSGVDRGIRRIRQQLDNVGATDSTVIIYLSDNGFSCGHHGIWGKGNGTFPLNFWDNSVRVPLVVHVPGGTTGHTDRLTSTRELHQTLCELAGIEPAPDRWRVPGSFTGALHGAAASGQEHTVVATEYGQGRMITDGQYVRVLRSNGPDELYDHEIDPAEQRNLAVVQDPAVNRVRRRLDDAMNDWFASYVRRDVDAFERPVTGLGQIHPLTRGRPDSENYVPARW